MRELLPVLSNIIIFKLKEEVSSDDFIAYLKKNNIVANTMGKQTMRFVTHLDFNDDDLEKVLHVISNFNIK